MSQGDAGRDPTQHLLSYARHERLPDGTSVQHPIPLATEAADLRRAVDAQRDEESDIDNDWHTGVVGMSKSRAAAIAALLDELAVRLKPGVAVDPIRADDSFAKLAADLAWDLEAWRNRSADGSD